MTTTADDSYTEYWVLWDGSLDASIDVADDGTIIAPDGGHSTLTSWLDAVESAARTEQVQVKVYAIHHYHAVDADLGDYGCECWQYATDYNPVYTFGQESED